MKKICVMMFIMTVLLLSGCGSKAPVSDNCALCGEPATKNYTNPQQMDFDMSRKAEDDEFERAVKYKPGEPVAACDKCFDVLEMMVGKSK